MLFGNKNYLFVFLILQNLDLGFKFKKSSIDSKSFVNALKILCSERGLLKAY